MQQGNKFCRVTGSPWRYNSGNIMGGHFPCSLNNFFHTESDAVSEIEDVASATFIKVLQRKNMRLSEVGNMDIISHAGSVFCVIVISEYVYCLSFPVRHLQNQRDKMTLRAVIFSDFPAYMRPACIKISKRNKSKIMSSRYPFEHPLH